MKTKHKKIKKFIKKIIKMSVLNSNFVIIYIILKMLVLLKNNLNYLKDSIFECFLRATIDS